MLAGSLFYGPRFGYGAIPVYLTISHARGHVVINFFYPFEAGLKRSVNAGASTAWRLFKRPRFVGPVGQTLCRKRAYPTRQTHSFTIFSRS
jgi:hypothetical protein